MPGMMCTFPGLERCVGTRPFNPKDFPCSAESFEDVLWNIINFISACRHAPKRIFRAPNHVLMKQLLLSLLLVSFSSLSALADSPEAILKDYRKQAAQAVERLNQSLEKAATPLITKLVQQGDTSGAEQLTKEMHAKIAGEPMAAPHASAAQLFSLYDEARAKALAPVQKSCIARIEGLLKTAGGAKLETVTELGKVRAEIEAGKVEGESSFPAEWAYKRTPTEREEATIWLNPGGKFVIDDGSVKKKGTWRRSADKGTVTIQMEDGEKWTVEIADKVGTIHRSIGTRYMVAK